MLRIIFMLYIQIVISESLMETNLHSLPDVLEVVLQDLLLLCHYCPSGVCCLAILQENKIFTSRRCTI